MSTKIIIRILDFFLSLILIVFLLPIFFILMVIGFSQTSSPIFFQKRMGINKREFTLVKFRTMPINTPFVSSHELTLTEISRYGRIMRRYKLDELPQLFNVLNGTMSLVGPRPNLITQCKVIFEREIHGIYQIKPGITGISQIKKIDMSTPKKLAISDSEMVKHLSVSKYLDILYQTLIGKGNGDAFRG